MHEGLASGGWGRLGLVAQLANVGSEVERTIRAWEQGRVDRFEMALQRALELFDLTAGDERWRGHRRREILRAREEFVRLFYGSPPESDAVRGIRRYFLAFAVLARRG